MAERNSLHSGNKSSLPEFVTWEPSLRSIFELGSTTSAPTGQQPFQFLCFVFFLFLVCSLCALFWSFFVFDVLVCVAEFEFPLPSRPHEFCGGFVCYGSLVADSGKLNKKVQDLLKAMTAKAAEVAGTEEAVSATFI